MKGKCVTEIKWCGNEKHKLKECIHRCSFFISKDIKVFLKRIIGYVNNELMIKRRMDRERVL